MMEKFPCLISNTHHKDTMSKKKKKGLVIQLKRSTQGILFSAKTNI